MSTQLVNGIPSNYQLPRRRSEGENDENNSQDHISDDENVEVNENHEQSNSSGNNSGQAAAAELRMLELKLANREFDLVARERMLMQQEAVVAASIKKRLAAAASSITRGGTQSNQQHQLQAPAAHSATSATSKTNITTTSAHVMVPRNHLALVVFVKEPKPKLLPLDSIVMGATLGTGTFSRVHQGTVAIPTAVRRLLPPRAEDPDWLIRQALTRAMISHPNVLRLFGIVEQAQLDEEPTTPAAAAVPDEPKPSPSRHKSSSSSSSSSKEHRNHHHHHHHHRQQQQQPPPSQSHHHQKETGSSSFQGVNGAFVEELVVGKSLHERLYAGQGRLSLQKAIAFAMQIADACVHLHSLQIAHGEINPRNILIDTTQNPEQIKLGGFSCAARIDHSSLRGNSEKSSSRDNIHDDLVEQGDETHSINLITKRCRCDVIRLLPFYSAPEVLSGANDVDESLDQYSFAMVVWEMLTSEPPFKELNFQELVEAVTVRHERPAIPRDCPMALAEIIQECWSHHSSQRPPFSSVLGRLRRLWHQVKSVPELTLGIAGTAEKATSFGIAIYAPTARRNSSSPVLVAATAPAQVPTVALGSRASTAPSSSAPSSHHRTQSSILFNNFQEQPRSQQSHANHGIQSQQHRQQMQHHQQMYPQRPVSAQSRSPSSKNTIINASSSSHRTQPTVVRHHSPSRAGNQHTISVRKSSSSIPLAASVPATVTGSTRLSKSPLATDVNSKSPSSGSSPNGIKLNLASLPAKPVSSSSSSRSAPSSLASTPRRSFSSAPAPQQQQQPQYYPQQIQQQQQQQQRKSLPGQYPQVAPSIRSLSLGGQQQLQPQLQPQSQQYRPRSQPQVQAYMNVSSSQHHHRSRSSHGQKSTSLNGPQRAI